MFLIVLDYQEHKLYFPRIPTMFYFTGMIPGIGSRFLLYLSCVDYKSITLLYIYLHRQMLFWPKRTTDFEVVLWNQKRNTPWLWPWPLLNHLNDDKKGCFPKSSTWLPANDLLIVMEEWFPMQFGVHALSTCSCCLFSIVVSYMHLSAKVMYTYKHVISYMRCQSIKKGLLVVSRVFGHQ